MKENLKTIAAVVTIILAILAVIGWHLDESAKTQIWKVVSISSLVLLAGGWAYLWNRSGEK
jgi:hypothetical protein